MNTAALPLVSLIVPIWGDDTLAAELVESHSLDPAVWEWVIAAVKPSPRLHALERQGAIRLVSCEHPSRGRQMNLGARQATGRLLCFHHADSELLPEHLRGLSEAALDEKIVGGAFHRKFDERHSWILGAKRLTRAISARAPLFGDQSIFVKAENFSRMGGFADIPLMEDIEFSRRLRRAGRIVLLDPPIRSSPRRFQRIGSWRSTAINTTFIMLFYLGVDPHRLHRWYYRGEIDARNSATNSPALPELLRNKSTLNRLSK